MSHVVDRLPSFCWWKSILKILALPTGGWTLGPSVQQARILSTRPLGWLVDDLNNEYLQSNLWLCCKRITGFVTLVPVHWFRTTWMVWCCLASNNQEIQGLKRHPYGYSRNPQPSTQISPVSQIRGSAPSNPTAKSWVDFSLLLGHQGICWTIVLVIHTLLVFSNYLRKWRKTLPSIHLR